LGLLLWDFLRFGYFIARNIPDSVYFLLWRFRMVIDLQVLFPVIPIVMILIMFARSRIFVAVSILLIVIFWQIITLATLSDEWTNMLIARAGDLKGDDYLIVIVMVTSWKLIQSVILLSVAPAKAISRRLIFLALGLLLLIALNELSK